MFTQGPYPTDVARGTNSSPTQAKIGLEWATLPYFPFNSITIKSKGLSPTFSGR
jgi:hypothetical protein